MNRIREEDIQEIIKRIPYKELEGKKFLITGGNGFIASYVVDVIMFLNKNYFENKCELFVLSRDFEKIRNKFCDYLEDMYFHPLIQSIEKKIDINTSVDYILHAAGSSSTKIQKQSPIDILKSNVVGTYNVLEYAKENKASSVLLFSSGAVYGKIPEREECISEKDYYNVNFMEPDNCYIEGKRMAEHLCFSYNKELNIPVKSIRISHTYGPGIDLTDGHVYSDFVNSIYNNQDIIIYGTGKDFRPFCYITDAVMAIFLILLRGKNGDVYNMANNDEGYTIYELALKLVSEGFPEKKLKVCGSRIDMSDKGKKIQVNISKLQDLGWVPKIDVIEGFKRTVKSFEENEI